ncbi:Nucleolar protein 56 [Friedmanniomyces endolithicus]|uniref:Nucleolar protein 56 n=1 Tax=Friedmanniomyces endolithicus TaxID=329885 RepID=A0AAN6K362_9PEZI|nr:Nucleolar protein 56 [Friedmanniomyces endolithicus]KAK0299686.1 Nucleolar protein 56 [Friedmanniomyces endolithicus]KAK0305639.1 Nucleolar protein 56 [Friedmanniomyces endolithicus]KAK0826098.1 Nucleolar protein 56 [Friedmanniomyces endolithicus]KAK0895911.1 Nucleolar protein 56 [Friedmanniomyces endolithicus]
MSVDYLLHESSVGYAVFSVRMQADTVGARLKEVQDAHTDLARFGKMVQLVSFAPFQGASQALENTNDVSEGIMSDYLRTVLESNLPKAGKKDKNKVTVGVSDKNLAGSIKAGFPGIECETGETSELAGDLLRGLRLHAEKLLKSLQTGDVSRAQLGLGHAYSRAKVKFSVQKNDNHIIQAIATLDHLEKAVNTFSMRVREWYSWHFPELIRIVSENHKYARCALFIGDKRQLSEESLHDLAKLVDDDESVARAIIEAARVSMGQDISETDMENVMMFAKRTVSLADYRKSLSGYLVAKMGIVAPNLAALIGETVGARLISHAGSLTNLAKYPASTVQILGAEKALFRALKTKGNTPKYGLIYHSSFIGRAGTKNKGRISRFLANKASIASRIDNFSMQPTRVFGEALKGQVEERLRFYAEGINPTKNADAMKAAMDATLNSINVADPTDAGAEDAISAPGVTDQATEQKKRKAADIDMADIDADTAADAKAAKKAEKKRRKSEGAAGSKADVDEEAVEKKLKKEKKEKRKSEGLNAGNVPEEQVKPEKKKKKSKA